jgi:hypothetical protein
MRQLMLDYAGTEMHRVPWVEIANKLAETSIGGKRDGKQYDSSLVRAACIHLRSSLCRGLNRV